ncbi:transforming acidic coiled-coil-containing protein 3 [Caerostris extrusa]|uniref:Transforming acidic coiled-coil-containing protein 3 n=1 Tax=Caerostris extrusa TaxID=172846 RepID=A0AAV4WUI5_CAEEX|nr:transforming acidic coiled-coil-containing protein 3 [Caerostris extrusa]
MGDASNTISYDENENRPANGRHNSDGNVVLGNNLTVIHSGPTDLGLHLSNAEDSFSSSYSNFFDKVESSNEAESFQSVNGSVLTETEIKHVSMPQNNENEIVNCSSTESEENIAIAKLVEDPNCSNSILLNPEITDNIQNNVNILESKEINHNSVVLEEDENNLCMSVTDLVDFSFKESETATNIPKDFPDFNSAFKYNDAITNFLQEMNANSSSKVPENLSKNSLEEMNMNSSSKVPENPSNNSLEEMNTNSSSKVPENPSNNSLEELDMNSSIKVPGNKSNNSLEEMNTNSSSKVPENKSNNSLEEMNANSSSKVPENKSNNSLEEMNTNSSSEVPENPSNNSFEELDMNSSIKVPGNKSNNSLEEMNTNSSSKVPENKSNNSLEEMNTNSSSKVPENPSNNSLEEMNTNSSSKVPENPSNNSLEEMNTNSSSKAPENPSNNSLEKNVTNLAYKMLENSTHDSHEESVIQFTNKMVKNSENNFGEIVCINSANKVSENQPNDLLNGTVPSLAYNMPENSINDYHEENGINSLYKVLENSPNFSPGQRVMSLAHNVSESSINNTCEKNDINSSYEIPESPVINVPQENVNNNSTCAEFENPTNNFEETVDANSAIKLAENTANASACISGVKTGNNLEENVTADFTSEKPIASESSTILEDLATVDPNVKESIKSINVPSKSAEKDLVFEQSENLNNDFIKSSNADAIFKIPDNLANNGAARISHEDFPFKVPDVPSDNTFKQLENMEFAFTLPENLPTNECDDEFSDAAQFFQDPSSFQFLENIRTSTVVPGPLIPRSSLYVNFDPLHSKFQSNALKSDNSELISTSLKETRISPDNSLNSGPEITNKNLADIAVRESVGNVLISFNSPQSSSKSGEREFVTLSPKKIYTEEELQQRLKLHELATQEAYLKKQREMELQFHKQQGLIKAQSSILEELLAVIIEFADDKKKLQEENTLLENEIKKLKEDLKTSTEDLQSVENTFADFHKRYEHCKVMLKSYKENEESLKQMNSDMQNKMKEQEEMYRMLQERAEEMLQKADAEVATIKRAGDAQVTVLKAQLKKAEMKISSLESDIKQIKLENNQLGGICDDLMAKVSRS